MHQRGRGSSAATGRRSGRLPQTAARSPEVRGGIVQTGRRRSWRCQRCPSPGGVCDAGFLLRECRRGCCLGLDDPADPEPSRFTPRQPRFRVVHVGESMHRGGMGRRPWDHRVGRDRGALERPTMGDPTDPAARSRVGLPQQRVVFVGYRLHRRRPSPTARPWRSLLPGSEYGVSGALGRVALVASADSNTPWCRSKQVCAERLGVVRNGQDVRARREHEHRRQPRPRGARGALERPTLGDLATPARRRE